jgi:hypothetical protein
MVVGQGNRGRHRVGCPVDHPQRARGDGHIGNVDGVGLWVGRDRRRTAAHGDGGRHRVGRPVDHRHLSEARIGDVDGVGLGVGRDPSRIEDPEDGGRDRVGRPSITDTV